MCVCVFSSVFYWKKEQYITKNEGDKVLGAIDDNKPSKEKKTRTPNHCPTVEFIFIPAVEIFLKKPCED